jgi:hypothetical protein
VTIKEANHHLYRFHDSYSRLPALLDLADKMRYRSWLRVLGLHWSGFDNVSAHLDDLYPMLEGQSPVRQMMTAKEWRVYEGLPEVVSIYRGAGEHNFIGASWSLDRKIAEKFPCLRRYRVPTPLLLTARARKEDILAVKLDRKEVEVVTFDPEIVSVEELGVCAA